MPSLRRVNKHVAWCANYEFEDVIREVDDVHLLELSEGDWTSMRQRLARSLAWRGRHPLFTRVNPGLKPIVVDRDYDVFFFVAMNVWDLLYLNSIKGWQARCRIKVCYLVEFYIGQEHELQHFLRALSGFDYVFHGLSSSVPVVSRAMGKPCLHLPYAVNALQFTPQPRPPQRVVDVLSVGGRPAGVHQGLLNMAARGDLYYVHDTIPSEFLRPGCAVQHRQMLANHAKRSRLFVAYEAKFGDPEAEGQSEIGARFFEGMAAGAVVLGRAPKVDAFRQHFPWPDAVVEVQADGSDVAAIVERLMADRDELLRTQGRNATHALRCHDWVYRWQLVLETIGLKRRPEVDTRLATLAQLAELTTNSRT